MKLAVGLIAIFLSLIVLLQSCTIFAGSGMLGNTATEEAGAIGVLVGVLLFVGGAFSFGLPVISVLLFALGGLLALGMAENFPDLGIWGWVSLAFAVLAFFAWRSDRKRKAVGVASSEAAK